MNETMVLTPERILEVTEDVLRRFGLAKATVVDVARALDVSHGSVYRHFPSKASLRDAVAKRWLERVNAPLEKSFTVIYWDQRGAGKSADPVIPRSSMTAEQFYGCMKRIGAPNKSLFACTIRASYVAPHALSIPEVENCVAAGCGDRHEQTSPSAKRGGVRKPRG